MKYLIKAPEYTLEIVESLRVGYPQSISIDLTEGRLDKDPGTVDKRVDIRDMTLAEISCLITDTSECSDRGIFTQNTEKKEILFGRESKSQNLLDIKSCLNVSVVFEPLSFGEPIADVVKKLQQRVDDVFAMFEINQPSAVDSTCIVATDNEKTIQSLEDQCATSSNGIHDLVIDEAIENKIAAEAVAEEELSADPIATIVDQQELAPLATIEAEKQNPVDRTTESPIPADRDKELSVIEKLNITAYNAIKLEGIIAKFCTIQDDVIDDDQERFSDDFMQDCLREHRSSVERLTAFKNSLLSGILPIRFYTELDKPVRIYIYEKILAGGKL